MSEWKKRTIEIGIVVVASYLTACSGEPGQTEIGEKPMPSPSTNVRVFGGGPDLVQLKIRATSKVSCNGQLIDGTHAYCPYYSDPPVGCCNINFDYYECLTQADCASSSGMWEGGGGSL